ncbi:MAG TPA: hypothetical protein VLR94_03940, partial [Acidobacteriota bacterium]|nr:hypothetical protein [Acidobacteriota bacterium]
MDPPPVNAFALMKTHFEIDREFKPLRHLECPRTTNPSHHEGDELHLSPDEMGDLHVKWNRIWQFPFAGAYIKNNLLKESFAVTRCGCKEHERILNIFDSI